MFASGEAFREWLAEHHASESELPVRLFKVHGVRRTGDEDTFTIRFTPRREKSTWSAVNIKRVKELEAHGRMHENGLAAFRRRSANRSEIYAYENRRARGGWRCSLTSRRRESPYHSSIGPRVDRGPVPSGEQIANL